MRRFRLLFGHSPSVRYASVADPERFDVAPDPDADPTFQADADPEPAPDPKFCLLGREKKNQIFIFFFFIILGKTGVGGGMWLGRRG